MNYCVIRSLTLGMVLCLMALSAFAQDVYTSSGKSVSQARKLQKQQDKGFDPSRIIFGGGLGGGLSDGAWAIQVSPVAGYKFSDRFAAGIGLGFQYFRVKDFWVFEDYNANPPTTYSYPFKASVYSGSVWGRYIVWRNLFAHLEYEHNFMSFNDYYQEWDWGQNKNIVKSKNINYQAPSVLVGAGLRQPIGERLSFIVMALYDVIQDKYSPYQKQIVLRLGFNVGF